ncbi:MAG: 30S ribosomal protein S20 [Candidatus Omnitrophica bacterium CG07_land_8_20_14_0_80_42_15]|uniref:Small ribosomal subunit protein bS20 n=1 Tax=Candidatus Aquitaenariimonas noxiae TaxID=1974741 RepID=A0A2J0KTJ0_9BACT|nr:MAG: 30S ribosomal protein S20 [Candidatus Omnitrophica bacterium CG07_land_8_20_14_0_80_42_15]
MPQLKAAYQYIKVSKKKHIRNQDVKNEIKTLVKQFTTLVASKDFENAKKTFSILVKKINKAKSKGIIHKKAASRKISRLAIKAAKFK